MEIIIQEGDTTIDKLPVEDIGILGELLVWKKLKELGIAGELFTFSNASNKGCDLTLIDGTTVEVKSARRSEYWDFRAMSKNHEIKTGGVFAFNVKNTPANFVIVYIVIGQEELFYIIPRKMLNDGVNKIHPDATRWRFFKDNWSLLHKELIE